VNIATKLAQVTTLLLPNGKRKFITKNDVDGWRTFVFSKKL